MHTWHDTRTAELSDETVCNMFHCKLSLLCCIAHHACCLKHAHECMSTAFQLLSSSVLETLLRSGLSCSNSLYFCREGFRSSSHNVAQTMQLSLARWQAALSAAWYTSAAGMGEGCAGGSASAGLPDWPAIQEIRGTYLVGYSPASCS